MTNEQLEEYRPIVENVAKKFARRYRCYVDPDDAAQTVATVALETRFDATRSELEIKKYLYARLYGAAQDAIRRERSGLRRGKAIRYAFFSDVARASSERFDERGVETVVEAASYRAGLDDERRRRIAELTRAIADRVAEFYATSQQKQAYRLYFLRGLTMKQVGDVLGVGESRVSQLIKQFVEAARPFFVAAGFSDGERRPGRRIR